MTTKTILAAGIALATVFASPAFAAPPKHRAPVANDTVSTYGRANGQFMARQSDLVTFGNRVVGEDPDLNIRSQLLHDPEPSEY